MSKDMTLKEWRELRGVEARADGGREARRDGPGANTGWSSRGRRRRLSRGAPAVTEKAFQAQVLGLARLSGWRCYHTFDSRKSAPGFPDLVLCRPPKVFFIELKTEKGTLRPEQRDWLDALGRCEGVGARLWRPSDWTQIEGTLATRARRSD